MTSDTRPERRDLMERLRAADPVAGAELDAKQRAEADALLHRIVAEPQSKPQPPRRPLAGWPHAVAAAVAVVCLGLAALVATNLVQDGDGPTIADRAYAAVSDDEVIYHYVLVTQTLTAPLPPKLRKDLELMNGRLEAWYRADGSALLSRQFRRDREGRLRLLYESAQRHGRVVDYDARRDVLGRSRRSDVRGRSRPVGPLDHFREAYRDGEVLERGKVTFHGRPAYRLLIRRGQGGSSTQWMAYYVDRKTYLPLGTRESTRLEIDGRSTRVRSESVYKVYERLRDTRANRELLRMSPHPRARRVDGPAFLAP